MIIKSIAIILRCGVLIGHGWASVWGSTEILVLLATRHTFSLNPFCAPFRWHSHLNSVLVDSTDNSLITFQWSTFENNRFANCKFFLCCFICHYTLVIWIRILLEVPSIDLIVLWNDTQIISFLHGNATSLIERVVKYESKLLEYMLYLASLSFVHSFNNPNSCLVFNQLTRSVLGS